MSDDTSQSQSVVFSGKQLRRARELLARFYGARRAVHLYPVQHPAVKDAVAGLMSLIGEYHAEGVDVPLTFFEDELLLGEQLLPEDSVLFDQLVRDMMAVGADSLTFARGLTAEELVRVLPILAADATVVESAGGIETLLAAADAPHVLVSSVTVLDRTDSGPTTEDEARQSYTGALDVLRELERVIQRGQVGMPIRVQSVVRSLVDNVLGNRYAMLELSGLRNYDEYTFFHSVNVAILSLALGSMISREWRFLSSLGVGALLHDIGKMTVDLAILNKPGALTAEEWTQVREHPLYGAETAAVIPGLDRSAVVVILEHHLRYDLGGYPQEAGGRRQHMASRIVAIADAYDAMTSRRSYSAARLQDEAVAILVRNVGGAFDPALVRLFVKMMGVYPPRSVVRLSTGEVGVVIRPGLDPTRPAVRIIADAEGALGEPFDVDLGEDKGRSVKGVLDPAGLNVEVDDYLADVPKGSVPGTQQ